MSKVDWIVMFVLLLFITFCFWMGGKWWFFTAGICTATVFAIGIGHWLQSAERSNHEKNWDNFLDTLQENKEKTANEVKSNQKLLIKK